MNLYCIKFFIITIVNACHTYARPTTPLGLVFGQEGRTETLFRNLNRINLARELIDTF